MKKLLIVTSFISILTFCLWSCKKEREVEPYPLDMKFDYYPLQVGKYITYKGDSFIYRDLLGQWDTISFEWRETIESSFLVPGSKDSTYRIYVDAKYAGSNSWSKVHTWYAQRKNNQLEKTEADYRYLKIDHPIIIGKEWNGNTYIPSPDPNPVDPYNYEYLYTKFLEGWTYKTVSTNVSETINNLSFSDVMLVSEIDDENLIEKKLSTAKYAYGVGMVERKVWHLETQNTNGAIPFVNRAENGYIFELSIIDHN